MFDDSLVIKAIEAGDHDGELVDIVAAVKARINETGTKVCWRITLDDLEITEQSLTLPEAMSVERQTGKRWGLWHPVNSAAEAGAVIVAVLIERQKMSTDDAFKRLGQYTAEQVISSISDYEPE